MTDADFSGNHLGSPGAIVLAAWLSSDKGALSKLDISNCELMAEGGKALAAGLKGNQVITKLNISGNLLGLNAGLDADTSSITAIADAIPDMVALIKLDIRSNYIGATQKRSLQRICVGSGIDLAILEKHWHQG
jgi:hypothetical protein